MTDTFRSAYLVDCLGLSGDAGKCVVTEEIRKILRKRGQSLKKAPRQQGAQSSRSMLALKFHCITNAAGMVVCPIFEITVPKTWKRGAIDLGARFHRVKLWPDSFTP